MVENVILQESEKCEVSRSWQCVHEDLYCQETLSVLLAGSRLDKMIRRLHIVLGRIQDFVIEAVINF